MRLGKIDYLNLLPFDVFIKRFPLSWQSKAILAHRKSYPAKLNRDFLFARLDGGFLSSIMAYGKRGMRLPCGIISHGEVWSVLALPKEAKGDYQSASSNALIQVLRIHAEVLIGDRALIYKLKGGEAIDLGKRWLEQKRLPFVFGLFCVSKNKHEAKRIASAFVRSRIRIPWYLLKDASDSRGIHPKDVLSYLQKISYRLGPKEKRGLEVFYRELLFLGIRSPKRFERRRDAISSKSL
ncbi:MqnA/MqnD/SBP family protein [Helicobacter pametensis]|uniref:MqnA/MqnD/SBP family protein n=1 Tax=Helicobacter pametensis TaxID=95149 RepID=UPI0004827F1D|nr:MqnA/MqnD/SBP family protein [Helicobacter pametensis]